jgi:hypothetical protein
MLQRGCQAAFERVDRQRTGGLEAVDVTLHDHPRQQALDERVADRPVAGLAEQAAERDR